VPADETHDSPHPAPAASRAPAGTATFTHAPDGTEPAPASSALVIPGYAVFDEVGAGGMGVVYRARELAFDRDVAVKVLQDRYRPDSPTARRFLGEARITAQLQHPAIPPVHHIGTLPDGRPFLVMKLIKGDTLAGRLEAAPEGRERLVPVFAQVCQAVAYAHARKFIHRDLKPQNVMVGAFGEVQVMDWGLAKVLADRPEAEGPAEAEDERTEVRTPHDADSATQAGSVLGTPAFMPPEQAGGEVDKVDERADVFGLGAVLCTVLTGQPPYTGPTTAVRLLSIRGETSDAFARLDACGADPELVALCKRCLARDPGGRPRDAGEVARAVTDHLAAAEERARQAEFDRVRAAERRKRRRVQVSLAAAAVGLVVAVGFGATVAALWRSAERARGDAEAARDGEAAARGEVEAARERLAAVEYGRTMQVAYRAWLENDAGATLALLATTKPELRGWEYRYLHGLCHTHLMTLRGHTDGVLHTAFSPGGSRILTCGRDEMVRVWDAGTGAELLRLKGAFPAPGVPAVFSGDGSRIIFVGQGAVARIWDAGTGAELLVRELNKGKELGTPSTPYRGIWFSPDGRRLLTFGSDLRFRIQDAVTGAELLTFNTTWDPDTPPEEFSVWSVGFSPRRHQDRQRRLRPDGPGVGREDRNRAPRPQGAHGRDHLRRIQSGRHPDRHVW
jgi:hypothetical protein